ncbi:oligogalacturonate-specific porin KdgM family protein [Yersinia nurmii]|uniref:Oligogalacturonate-specific porin KdgM family protein n=1 Tax=Yersinia nurmii TaxID=685706 RepID=A0AAW7K8D6_9GAMM|nr:oligogalacturonate-specific porin KdgM family protein [Yersinia nurmii]MDN0087225.1 oligogalacturonate-specific porin KdgM family protein [Yersinia nurmii]CNE98181.1 oligogalacturonate-specific porin protein KdgM [Yersinia nurmii]
MKFKLITLAMASVISFSSVATTIDYRHEMLDSGSNDHKDRLLFSNRFANGFGLSLEGKWRQHSSDNTTNKPFHEQVSNGTEVVASYVYKFNKTFQLEPGFSLESSSDSNNYRPYLRGKVAFTDDFSTSLRYRPYYKRNQPSTKDTEKGHQFTLLFAYSFLKDYSVEYELDYKKSEDKILANNEKYDWSHDVKLAYKWDKNWKPYVAIGNVSGSSLTDERQTRFRMGVQYTF